MLSTVKIISTPAATADANPLEITNVLLSATVHLEEVLEIDVAPLTHELALLFSTVISLGNIIVKVDPTVMLFSHVKTIV